MRDPVVRDLELPDGRSLRIRRWPGKGVSLVLLHGLLDDSEGWAQLAAATERPCVAIDLPGFGGSALPTRPRISAYAEDVADGLRTLGLARCVLVGHSLGGAVAAAVSERTTIVESLALLAPAGFGHIRLAELIALPVVIDAAQLALPLALVSPLLITAGYTTFVAHGRLPSPDLTDRLRRRAWQSGPGVRAAVTAISAAGRSPNGFAQRRIAFRGPVAALFGDNDALVPVRHAEAVRTALPQAHIEVWEGMGHHPQRERPAQLDNYIETCAVNARRHEPSRRRAKRDAA